MSEHLLLIFETMGPPPHHHVHQNQESQHLVHSDDSDSENTQLEQSLSMLTDPPSSNITVSADMSKDKLYKVSKCDGRDSYF